LLSIPLCGYPPFVTVSGLPPFTVSGIPPLTVSGLPPFTVSGIPPLTVSGLPPFTVDVCGSDRIIHWLVGWRDSFAFYLLDFGVLGI